MRKHHEVYNFFCRTDDGIERERQLIEDIKREVAAGEHTSFTTLAKAVKSDRTRVRNTINAHIELYKLYNDKKRKVRADSFVESISEIERLYSEGRTIQQAALEYGIPWQTYYRRKRIVGEVLTGQTS